MTLEDEFPVDPDTFALVSELREIAVRLTDCRLTPEVSAAALPLARELRARIEGERRPRWYEFDPSRPTEGGAREAFLDLSPLRGRLNPVAPPLRFDRIETPEGPRLRGEVRLSRAYEGPPHGVHGGFVAALFDEMLGGAQNLSPPVGVTAKLEVRYRELTPIEEDLVFEAWIHDERERRIETRATCHAGGVLTADAVGHFIRVDFAEVRERMAGRKE